MESNKLKITAFKQQIIIEEIDGELANIVMKSATSTERARAGIDWRQPKAIILRA